MDYADKISTLQEKAVIQLAINLCQGNSFKELALCVAKPTYGYISRNLFFVSDQKNSSEKPYIIEQLEIALEKESQRLTEELPHLLRDRLRIWINRIALEYYSYRCRLELLFGVSRYFLMTILSIGDWKETGRLDEKKVAVRLLEDKRLTVLQKYHIACVYCLHPHIPELWKRLTKEEISLIAEDIEIYRERIDLDMDMFTAHQAVRNILVLFWSHQMITKEKVTERELWTSAALHAIYFGNRAALEVCWERLTEQARQQIVVDMALRSLLKYTQRWGGSVNFSLIQLLEEISWPDTDLIRDIFNLRSHYAELMLFFLSQMDEEQKWTFFKRAFSEYDMDLRDFFDWPLQHELLQTINRLWGSIAKDRYRQCMMSLAHKCNDALTKENHIDEYRSLFWKLWETTPEELKQYIFNNEGDCFDLLYILLPRFPFLKEHEALFNRVFSDLSKEGRREMICCDDGSKFLTTFLEEGRWIFLNWFLEECLSKEEISSLKKKFIKSVFGGYWCLDQLRENGERFVEDVIDWCFEFESEKSQFKCELMNSEQLDVKTSVCDFLLEGDFDEVERMVNFFASSDEMKKEIKADFALCVCKDILGSDMTCAAWKKMDELLSWSLASDDKIRDIKEYLLSQEGIESHFAIAFLGEKTWEEVERFYKWFGLSPEEIEDHKDIVFNDRYLIKITSLFLYEEKDIVTPLRWFLTNEEKVMRFKERFESTIEGFYHDFSELEPVPKETLDYLENELLRGLRKEENRNDTGRGGTFVENKGEKRSSVEIEDESGSQSKRCMKVKSKIKR